MLLKNQWATRTNFILNNIDYLLIYLLLRKERFALFFFTGNKKVMLKVE